MVDLLLRVLGRRVRYRISGESMAPGLRSGDEVRVDPYAYRRRPPRVGDVVLARHPYRRDVKIVKRVSRVTAEGKLFLVGDNPDSLQSSDSRSFGAIAVGAIEGRVVRGK
ncbi:MAG: nickel-type superoxide dismutase maturation protease [Gemmatimonadales bacterium]|jgi:nickel-type superoxide dismutase maturation protease|nr:nickel-type superoxide dismutase maturation protease [Gemmatimonadales bacterium]